MSWDLCTNSMPKNRQVKQKNLEKSNLHSLYPIPYPEYHLHNKLCQLHRRIQIYVVDKFPKTTKFFQRQNNRFSGTSIFDAMNNDVIPSN